MLNQSPETIPGVGPALAKKLAQCRLYTLQDILFHLPFRYQDRTHITPIQDLHANDWAVIEGIIVNVEVLSGKKPMLDCYIDDSTGLLRLRFFHFTRQWLQVIQKKPLIRAFGEIRSFANTLEMVHPDYKIITSRENSPIEETLTPIYSTTQGLSQTRLRQIVKQTFLICNEHLATLEWMTPTQLNDRAMLALNEALNILHAPTIDTSLSMLIDGTHPALKRLAFEELFAQQLGMRIARRKRAHLIAPICQPSPTITQKLLTALPFALTNAQLRVFQEISADLAQKKPMLRLVQGDVGCGKTIVSALAALQAITNGYQVALMAPTELLSEQHAKTLSAWLTPLGYSVHRLSGSMNTKTRKATQEALINHTGNLFVGTHALFQNDVIFARLGLIIIDEQHRFGVEQRLLLHKKGQIDNYVPHQLLMTATPIPRTLVMTQLAYLDVSIINERPPGRTPITTTLMAQTKRCQVINRLQAAIDSGRQIYWVCTLIEESENLQCMAATSSALNLQEQLPKARIGLVHGRMKATEKESIMLAFQQGTLDILVATTVIEVGVDVPNASLMIIENAERLGLSQLHQLRGRVGRGQTASHCVLLYQPPLSFQGRERLSLMRETTDGFLIAEKDLELRGFGEILGKRQTGEPVFKIANPQRDHAMLADIPSLAEDLLQQQPTTAHMLATRWMGDVETFLQG